MDLLVEAAKPMIEVMVRRAMEEMGHLRGYEEELGKAQEKIQIIGSIILNMPSTNIDKAVEVWLKKVFPIIHRLDNLFDVLAYEKQHLVVLKNKSRGSKTGKLKRLTVFPLKRLVLQRKIGRWIKKINAEIKEALKYAETIVSLKNLVRSATLAPVTRNTGASDGVVSTDTLEDVRCNVDTSMFVGRGSDVDSIVRILCNPSRVSHSRLPVVAIVGLGGMGKTSLAKQIYENKQVKSYFSDRIWITVPRDFNIKLTLKGMLEFLKRSHNEDVSSEIIISNLKDYLAGKRYLLVMDDVWNTDQLRWDAMRNALERIGGSMDSMILATTRNDTVAEIMSAQVHNLSGLLEDDSWLLFEQIAFADRSQDDTFMLKPIAKKIYQKCSGVPMAIKSVAGILRSKRRLYEWENFEKSELWKVHDDTGILPSLKLSYDHLASPFIKKCFSLCALWPKGYNFEKYNIIDRWIALGLTQQPNGKKLEDVAEEYFDALVSISFLVVYKTNEFGEATHYIMHDLVYDLARSVAEHDRVYLEVEKEKNSSLDIQHLTVIGSARTLEDISEKELEHLCSLEFFKTFPKGLLMHTRYLRVLSIVSIGLEEVPESIAGLKCLKFLDLHGNPITLLPGCIMGLYNLQSLILYSTLLSDVPQGLNHLSNLRHLGLSCYISPSQGTIRQLTHLHTLPPLQLSKEGFMISELEYLNCLKGKIEIRGLELIKSKKDAEIANLSKKTRLEELRLQWDNNSSCANEEDVLNALYPNPNLKVLSIKGYEGIEFPSWLISMTVMKENHAIALNNLQKIELVDCGRCSKLPTLGNLPNLKLMVIAKLDNLECITSEFYCGADILLENSSSSSLVKSKCYFRKLKEFRLCNLPNLEEWCEPEARTEEWVAFESLEVLVIKDCPSLTTMPCNFQSLQQLTMKSIKSGHPLSRILSNKNTLTSLKNIHIEEMEGLTHLPEVPKYLSKLMIIECDNLESLPNLNGHEFLRELLIFNNSGLTSAPEGMQSCYSLQKVWYSLCPKVETLPDLTGLTQLIELCIRGMTKMIIQPPEWLYSHPSLEWLHVGTYMELNEFPDISCLLKITSLKYLHLYGWKSVQSLPTQLKHFTTLAELILYDFNNLESLPSWIQNLSSLQILCLRKCRKLKELASAEAMNNLTKLVYMEIEECPMLEENIKAKGTEYHKIPPRVEVNIIDG